MLKKDKMERDQHQAKKQCQHRLWYSSLRKLLLRKLNGQEKTLLIIILFTLLAQHNSLIEEVFYKTAYFQKVKNNC